MSQEFSYGSSNRSVAKLKMLPNAGLAGKIKDHYVAFNGHMLGPQRRESKAPIFMRVNLAAGPDENNRQNPEYGRHHPRSVEFPLTQVFSNSLSHYRQLFGEFQKPLKFSLFPIPDVIGVIKVLPTTGRILAHRLDRAGDRRTNADLFPRRRNLHLFNS